MGPAVASDFLYSFAAVQVSSVLSMLASELSQTVDNVNEVAAASLGNADTPVGAVVRILNGQMQALNHLETRVDELSQEVDGLSIGRNGQRSSLAAGSAA